MPLEDFRFQLSLVRALDFDGHKERLQRVAVPTLVAWAEDDHLIEPEVSRELFAAIPGARPLTFPTGGHNLQKTQAEAVAAAILALLAPPGEA
jgi:pimeloyl-ACP methyl ester carboxylesterase